MRIEQRHAPPIEGQCWERREGAGKGGGGGEEDEGGMQGRRDGVCLTCMAQRSALRG